LDSFEEVVAEARDLIEHGRFERASEGIALIKTMAPYRPEGMLLQARMLELQGYLLRALDVLEPLLRDHPANFGIATRYAAMATRAGQVERALCAIEPLRPLNQQQSIVLLIMRGLVARQSFQYHQAIDCYYRALEVDPSHSNLLINLAEDLAVLGRTAEARKHLGKAGNLLNERSIGERVKLAVVKSLADLTDEEPRARDLLKQALSHSSGTPLLSLDALCLEYPNHIPTHLAFLRQMRLRGDFDRSDRERSAAIPKVIVQYWDEPVVPGDVRAVMETWRSICHGLEHLVFNDATARRYIAQTQEERVIDAYRQCTHPAMKSDLFRLCYAYRDGGFYVDADEVCTAQPDATLPQCADLVVVQETHGAIWNGFFGVCSGHPAIGAILADVVNRILERREGTLWAVSGPGVWSKEISTFVLKNRGQRNSIAVLPHSFSKKWCGTALKLDYKGNRRSWQQALASGDSLYSTDQ
jgi:tetratricopeptide (TPR) repeat protein